MIEILTETLDQTCFACPSQWSAETKEGKDVYIRLRHGFFYVNVNEERVFEDFPEGYDGVMSTSSMEKLLVDSEKFKFV